MKQRREIFQSTLIVTSTMMFVLMLGALSVGAFLLVYLIFDSLMYDDISYTSFFFSALLLCATFCLHKMKYVLVTFAGLFFVVGIIEKIQIFKLMVAKQGFSHPVHASFIRKDEVLGFSPKRNSVDTVLAKYYNTLLYKAVYTTDRHCLRRCETPDDASDAILFFGDEVMFGVGLNDENTIPAQVQRADSTYAVTNFSFFRYGANQMLAAVSSGRIDSVVDCREPKIIIYQASMDHISRYLNSRGLLNHDPQYVLAQSSDSIIFDGNFDERFSRRFLKINDSFLLRYFTEADRTELYIRLLLEAQREFKKRYPTAVFHIIWWNDQSEAEENMLAKLKENGFRVHELSSIVTDYNINRAKYSIFYPLVNSPNKLLASVVSDYIQTNVMR